MPAILDSCVRQVMAKGHSESSAYAICRTSLGLKSDGTEDDKDPGISDEQMKARVEIALQFRNGPSLIKDMTICGPMGRFVNGDQKGVMSRSRLSALAERFKKFKRQVPIFLEEDHPETNNAATPVGWVEGLRMVGDDLVARVKLHGAGALAVGGDLIRLASIFTVQGKDYDGSPVGEVLKHLLLSNESFYKDNNIAASKLQGEELVACFSTALPSRKESNMTEQEVTKLKEENEALKEQIKAATAQSADEKVANLESLVQEKTRENLELIAANENLKADVEKFKSPKAIEELNKKVAMQDRQLRAEKIRRLVKSGVESGQFDRALVGDPKTNYEHQSDEMVLSWFKTSAFKDSFERLEIMLETMPKKRLNRTFAAGDYSEPKGIVANEEEKNVLATLGHTPEEIMAALKAKGAGEYAKLTAKKE